MNRTLSTLHVQTQTLCPHDTHDVRHSRVAQVVASIKNISSSCHLSRAMSFDQHSTPSLLFSTLSSSASPTLSGSCSCSTSFQPRTCADPRGPGSDGFTESEPRTFYEPRRLSTSLSRSSLNKRVLTLPKITSTTLLKRVRFQKLRISSLHHTTSHWGLRPKIPLKALPRLKKQTWTTNKFVLCWLHHCTCRSETQVRNDHKFITLKEKVWCQLHLKV